VSSQVLGRNNTFPDKVTDKDVDVVTDVPAQKLMVKYAAFAKDAYEPTQSLDHTLLRWYRRVTFDQALQTKPEYRVVYENIDNPNECILSFRGTVITNGEDRKDDALIAFSSPQNSPRYVDSLAYSLIARQKYPSLCLTGHSLGSHQAQFFAGELAETYFIPVDLNVSYAQPLDHIEYLYESRQDFDPFTGQPTKPLNYHAPRSKYCTMFRCASDPIAHTPFDASIQRIYVVPQHKDQVGIIGGHSMANFLTYPDTSSPP
jgi:hypothetical protein